MGEDPSAEMIGVLIIDDHRMFAESLARLLADEPAVSVLGVATSGREGTEMARRLHPRVVLVDYGMPERDGAEIAAEIKRDDPTTIVVMLTGAGDDRVLVAAIDAGCSGFITKDRAANEVGDVIRAAAAGDLLLSPAQLARLLPKLRRGPGPVGDRLTDRERELLVHLARGGTNKAIAAEMHLSVNTVRNYVQSVLSKLGAHSKLEAVAIAVRAGIVVYPADP